MEHLNRECKQGISGLGTNITDVSIQRIGKCIGRIYSTLLQHDTVNAVKQESGHHTCHFTEVDLKKMVKQLQDSLVFSIVPGRSHKHSQNQLTLKRKAFSLDAYPYARPPSLSLITNSNIINIVCKTSYIVCKTSFFITINFH